MNNIPLLLARLFALILLVIACKENRPDKAQKIRIGISISNFNDTFLMSVKDGMEKYANEFYKDKVELTYADAKEDTSTQMGQVENFITQNMQAIIVIPVNTEATSPISELAISKKIPLVYANRKPSNLPKGVYFVGSDNKIAGEIQGKYLVDKLAGKGNIAIIQGILANEATLARTAGVHEFVEKNPGMKVTKIQAANWDRAQGMAIMENWLISGDRIDAVASNNDDMAIGALEAIKTAGKLGKILVIGVDATPDGLAQVKAGNLSATVFQDGYGQGSGAIKTAMEIINKKQVEQMNLIPFQLVTANNIDMLAKK